MGIIKKAALKLGIHKTKFILDWYHKFLKFRHKLPDRDDLIVNVDGQHLIIWNPCHGSMGRDLFVKGVFEKEVTNLISDITKENMRVLDVGADLGYHTI